MRICSISQRATASRKRSKPGRLSVAPLWPEWVLAGGLQSLQLLLDRLSLGLVRAGDPRVQGNVHWHPPSFERKRCEYKTNLQRIGRLDPSVAGHQGRSPDSGEASRGV